MRVNEKQRELIAWYDHLFVMLLIISMSILVLLMKPVLWLRERL